MGEFAENILGIKEACEFLDYPVVSGNVSFYNGTNKNNIYPTPVIGGVGLIKNLNKIYNHRFKKIDSQILVIGKTFGHLGQSAYLNELFNLFEGMPPEINLYNEKNNGECLLKLINKNLVLSSHDVSSGGLIISLAEMSIGSNIGAKILKPKRLTNSINYFFGEDQARYIIEVNNKDLVKVDKVLKGNNVFYENIGVTQPNFFEIEDELKINNLEIFVSY